MDCRTILRRICRGELAELARSLVRIDSVIRPETGGTGREVTAFGTGTPAGGEE